MKQDLQAEVNRWSNPTTIKEQRSVSEQSSPVAHGELLLVLRMSVTITVGQKSQTIATRGLFPTIENSVPNPDSPQDCYRFRRIAARFENEFFDEYERVVNYLIDDQYGDGFTQPA